MRSTLLFSWLVALPIAASKFLTNVRRHNEASRRTDGLLDLYPLDDAEAQERGAVCLDGSAPGVYFEPADTNADPTAATKWVIAFKGGGWCWNEADCAARARGAEGSARESTLKNTMSLFGNGPLFGFAKSEFASYNHVVLWYCDGGAFAGDRADPVAVPDPWDASKNITLYFRGARVLDFMFDSLKKSPFGLNDATEVLLTGGSAGAFSAYMHADKIAKMLPASVTKFRVAPINGWFAYVPGFFQQAQRNFLQEFFYFYHMQNLTGAGPAACHAALPKAERIKCVFTDYSYTYSKTPMFPMQALDMFVASSNTSSPDFALSNLNCVMKQLDEKVCTTEDVGRLATHLDNLQQVFKGSEKSQRPGEGGFLTSCNGHRLYESPLFYKVGDAGVSMPEALAAWWNSDSKVSAAWHTPCALHTKAPYQCEASC